MRKTPLNKISPKQSNELAKRRFLKYQLWISQEGKCAKCGRYLKWHEAELSHKKHLSQGGLTEAKNCEVLCNSFIGGCHANKEHGLRNKYNEQPKWSKGA